MPIVLTAGANMSAVYWAFIQALQPIRATAVYYHSSLYVGHWSISLVMSRADPSAASTEILRGKALNYWQSNSATMSIVRGPRSVCDFSDGRFSMNSFIYLFI